MSVPVRHLIAGAFVEGLGAQRIPVSNPLDNSTLAEIACASAEQIEQAVASARETFASWKETPVSERARVMLRYQALLKEHHDELAKIVSSELGKTFEDAKGDVWRGIEVVEHACNVPSLLMGETVENVARNIDTYSITQPLGVCVGITPFNFPAMIPLWMFPLAIACGNAFILKPSEQVPLTSVRLAELFLEAGAPKGVLQVVHGGKEQVDQLLKHPQVKAVSFVGSVAVGQYVYHTGTAHNKRVQSFAGAKNHMVIMPDADKAQVISNLVGASVGAAGQRCMAISVAVLVGAAREWIPEIRDALAKVRPGPWDDSGASYGPVINPQAKARIERLIGQGVEEGAQLLLDGRGYKVEGYPDGNWVGPTLFAGVRPDMAIYREEVFGPVLCLAEVDSLEQAIRLINESPYGPSAKARAAMQQAAALCGRYDYDAQDALVGLFAKQNGIPAESVHAYCGSRQPLQYAVAAFTGKERSLVMADPSYDSVLGAAQAQGAKVAAVPLDAEAAHDIERMLAAAQRDAGLIYICNPNNPTGTLTPHERIVRAIERKPERSVVLVDEAYIHFSDAPSVVGLAVQRQDVLVLRTFSKLYGMAGARLGLAIGHPQLLARLERFGGHNVVPSPTAHAGLESLRDDDLVPRRKQQNAEVRERTIAWLRQQGFRCTASQSNCFMVDMRRPAELVIAELEKQRVHVGRPWASWPNWVRVTVGSEEEMQAFRSAFASVSRRHQVAMR
ncbi:TPA: CoA-acylating methylmalonate-semialdehyde dehydrogenase [Pseudomonas aeruginosa]